MALRRWKKLSSDLVLANGWWKYQKDAFVLPSGKNGEYHYVHTNGASLIIPVLDDGRILLVNQYRYLNEKESIEFPCGGVKDGHTYEETARHELVEETGYEAGLMEEIGAFNPYNGVTDEICRMFVAGKLEHVGARPDMTEEFEYLQVTPSEIDAMIGSGKIWDGMTIAAWCIVRQKGVAGIP